eukprot:3022268-Alexandrium_andersonii.AAC.1
MPVQLRRANVKLFVRSLLPAKNMLRAIGLRVAGGADGGESAAGPRQRWRPGGGRLGARGP